MSRARRWWPAAAWMAVILFLTSIPNPSVPQVSGLDKIVHFGLYGVLGVLAVRGLEPTAGVPARLATIAVVSLLAAADEWHQQFIPGRSADVADWAADTLGAGTAILTAAARRARREPSP